MAGRGAGVLRRPRIDLATGSNPKSVAIGHFVGDGQSDLEVANWGANTVSVMLGNGAGGFDPKTDLAIGNHP